MGPELAWRLQHVWPNGQPNLTDVDLSTLDDKEARRIVNQVEDVKREFERFVGLHDQLGTHLDHAMKKFDETERALARASGAIEGLAQVPIAAGGEQVALPLGIDSRGDED